MTASVVAVDYSRPIHSLFEQGQRVGTIHSVFKNAVNIALDDNLLALLSNALPRMPNSMRLSSMVMDELLPKLRPDMEVQIDFERVYFPARNFSLYLPEATPWEPKPDITSYQWRKESVAQHVRLLAQFLANKPQQGGLAPLVRPLLLGQPVQETPLLQMALPRLRLLAQASWQQNIVDVAEATRGLAGLGPGLTPSGDDVLGGFAAIMALFSPKLSADTVSRIHIAATIAGVARLRTTALSSILLTHASHGEIAEQFGTLLLALALPVKSVEIVVNAADRVLDYGATSGGDTLLGILLGLRVLEGDFN